MKAFFYKYEWAFLLLGLAFVLTFVPYLISAESWLAFGLGVVYLTGMVVWIIAWICQIDGPRN